MPPKASLTEKKISPKINKLKIHHNSKIIDEDHLKKKEERIHKKMFSVARSWERKKLEILQMDHEKSLSSFIFDSSLPKLLIPNVLSLEKDEEFIRLEIIKSPIPFNFICTNFLITSRGVVGSLRKQKNKAVKEVIIGRQGMDENGQMYSDIWLHDKNLCVSRTHCKLIYSNWLREKQISPNFFSFLQVNFRKGNILPQFILRIICQFCNEKRKLLISDMGSISGSFLKVKSGEYFELRKNMEFLFSANIGFEILEIYERLDDFLYNFDNSVVLFKFFSENKEGNLQIFEQFIQKVFKNMYINFDIKNMSELFTFSGLSCILIRFFERDSMDMIHNNKKGDFLFLNYQIEKNKNFKIIFGPNENGYFRLISGISLEFSCDRKSKKWFVRNFSSDIHDENENMILKKSFGLWNSLSNSKNGKMRYEPLLRVVKNQDEIKVSETVFRINC